MSEPSNLFTFEEVKNELCDACRLNIPDSWNVGIARTDITHHINGIDIPCGATKWRISRSVRNKAFPAEQEGLRK